MIKISLSRIKMNDFNNLRVNYKHQKGINALLNKSKNFQ